MDRARSVAGNGCSVRRRAIPAMLIEAVPLILLYELSVILAKVFGRPPEGATDRDITVSEPPPSGAA